MPDLVQSFGERSSVLKRIFANSDALVSGGGRDYSLDGLRAIAALWVFATHATYSHLLPPLLNFRGAGRAGVVLFFFLSAFLLSAPFFRDRDKALSWQAWQTYGLRRLFRIVPLYFVVLLALFCAGITPFEESSLHDSRQLLAQHLIFQKGSSVFWTIVVEMRFYLLLPLLLILSALVLKRWKNGRLIIGVAGCLWLAGAIAGVTDGGHLRHLGIGKHAPVFIAGILTALIYHTWSIHGQNRAGRVLFECLAWGSAVLFVCLSMPALYYAITQGSSISGYAETRSPMFEAFWDARIPWIGLVLGLLFFSYPNGTGFMGRLLGWAPLVWIGRVSFGVYLIHLTVLQTLVTFDLPATITLFLALALSGGIASLLFLILEAPMISLGQRLNTRIKAGTEESEPRAEPLTSP